MQMLLKSSQPVVRVRGCSRRTATVVRAEYQGAPKLPIDPSAIVGERVGRWLSTPWDLMTFGPRASAGALVSLPERLQTLQLDVQRVMELVQDPRPVEEKSSLLMQEVETTMLEFLEKGVNVEQDVIANLKTVLPPEAASVLSELIPQPPNSQYPQTGPTVPVEPELYITTADVLSSSAAPTVTYGQQDVMSMQAASEINEIRLAVAGLKSALEAMRTNTDVAAASMLKMNLREARDQLGRRLMEVSPATAPDPSVAAATREATILLDEVNTAFFN